MNIKQKKIKIEPRIKLNYNICNKRLPDISVCKTNLLQELQQKEQFPLIHSFQEIGPEVNLTNNKSASPNLLSAYIVGSAFSRAWLSSVEEVEPNGKDILQTSKLNTALILLIYTFI